MSKKYEGPNGIIVRAYTAKDAALNMMNSMENCFPHRIWVKSIKSGRFPIISKMKDGVVYGKIHRFCCDWLCREGAVTEYFAESIHDYDNCDEKTIRVIAGKLGLNASELGSYSPKDIDATYVQKLLFAIDNNQESLKIYDAIINSGIAFLFGDPTKLSVKTSNPEYITIKERHNKETWSINIKRGTSVISAVCGMQKKYETLKNTQRELGAGVDFYVAKCETMKEEIEKLNAKLEKAENKAKIFEESFIRVEEENDRLRANAN